MLYLGFNTLPRSVFWSADLNGRSDNTDVIRLAKKFMNQNLEQFELDREWLVEFTLPLLFLIDVAILFAGMFVSLMDAWWIVWPFRLFAMGFTLYVVQLAYRVKHLVPESIPCQRFLGCLLYISCHVIHFYGPSELPLFLVAYILFAGAISMFFLFDDTMS